MDTLLLTRDFSGQPLDRATLGIPNEVLAIKSVQKLLNRTPRNSSRSCRVMRRAIGHVLRDLGVETSNTETRELVYPDFIQGLTFVRQSDARSPSEIEHQYRQLPNGELEPAVAFDSGHIGLGTRGQALAQVDRNNTLVLPYYWAVRAKNGEHPLLPNWSHERTHVQINEARYKKEFPPWTLGITTQPSQTTEELGYQFFRVDEGLAAIRELKIMTNAMRAVLSEKSISEVARTNFQDAYETQVEDKLLLLRRFSIVTMSLAHTLLVYGDRFLEPSLVNIHTANTDSYFAVKSTARVRSSKVDFNHTVFLGQSSPYSIGMSTAVGLARLGRGASGLYTQGSMIIGEMLETLSGSKTATHARLLQQSSIYRDESTKWIDAMSDYGDHCPEVYRLASIFGERFDLPIRQGYEIVMMAMQGDRQIPAERHLRA